jgi:pimeloyl-ACP methyl ester carboxylesterase
MKKANAMLNRFFLTVALMLLAATPVRAADAGATLHVDSAYVTKTGAGSRAVILIPGLGFGGFVFDGIVPSLAKRYTVYVVTFAGFDGEPPAQGPYLDAFAKSIVDLIAQEHLQKPILIGHSLGGHLAIRVAATVPAQIGGVVVIDSLALYPPLRPGDTLPERRTTMQYVRDQMMAAPQAAWDAQAKSTVATMVTDPATADVLLAHEAKGDRATFLGAFYEMSLADLHPVLASITAPVLVLAASPSEAQAEMTRGFYLADYAGTPHLDVIAIAPSKHFIMYDQPDRFARAIDAFLAKTAP